MAYKEKNKLLLDIKINNIVITHLTKEISKLLSKAMELEETRDILEEENKEIVEKIKGLDQNNRKEDLK